MLEIRYAYKRDNYLEFNFRMLVCVELLVLILGISDTSDLKEFYVFLLANLGSP